MVALLVTGAGRSGAAPGRRGDCSSAVSELLLALVKNVAMWKEARGDRGNIHSPSVAEECRGEREEKREGREGGKEGGSKERRPFTLCFGGVERGERNQPQISNSPQSPETRTPVCSSYWAGPPPPGPTRRKRSQSEWSVSTDGRPLVGWSVRIRVCT